MKLSNLSIVAILSLSSSIADAECLPWGPIGFRTAARRMTRGICTTIIGQGAFRPYEARNACQATDNIHWDFKVESLTRDVRSLTLSRCMEYMQIGLRNCQAGDDSSYSDIGWRFVSDANTSMTCD
ncbi:hypothetical protein DSL72_007124 [Monilinia vaccinii-corymbosi]|uniref:Cyanovirin-N domain-containing protein n=1 Tax=Monilinia vaccinii-corymbosi TaxID=61207 RepID=A0A8A3PLJ1_9HELO|nr:hypothetical protein DSL72_007124 [Monilinia vaccinii-corymbosi]